MIQELSDSEFQATFAAPMRLLGADKKFKAIPIVDYVMEVFVAHEIAATLQETQIEYIYIAGDGRHAHMLIDYGVRDLYLVLVIEHQADSVLGYHFLNLANKAGLEGAPENG